VHQRIFVLLSLTPAIGYLFAGAPPAKGPAKSAVPASFEAIVQPFLSKNCFMCHNQKLHSGELDLKTHAQPETLLKDREIWENVVAKIKSGEMPPKGLPRPKAEEVSAVAGWIQGEYDRLDANAAPDPGRVTARRLNRYEYNSTVRDLTGINFRPADDFPADDSGYGFDNIGDVLSLSPVLMEKYMTAAEKIVRRAIVVGPPQFKPTRALLKAETAGMGEHFKVAPLKPGAVGPMPSKTALHMRYGFPVQADYEIRVSLGGIRPDTAPPVKMAFWLDDKQIQEFEVIPQRDKKRNFELKLPVAAGSRMLSAAFVNDDFDPAKNPITARDRYLTIETFEIRGPFNAVAPPLPESQKLLISCGHEANQHQPACARKVVGDIARRGFRRPPTEKELNRLLAFVDEAQKEGDSFEQGIRIALQAVLVSPQFLFRIERDPNPANGQTEHAISDFELATRLSYFLWSSMPDDELLAAAESGRLRKPSVLKAQVARMIRDPKAKALAENFAGQWLQLRNLDEAKPDPDRFPGFDDELRRAMKRETELFFEAVVKEDRSILDFLDAKFTYLNDRLAQHYGIAGVDGSEFRRVALTGDQRSGILTQASILTVSSYPNRTSPVIRGKWVLENILNAPPPPPPPGVPNLDEAAVGNTGSLRQQLEKHRSNAICASCHSRMDPLGFGLENYDAIGAWRTQDGKFPIDSTGTLPNGKSFTKPAELKAILRADKDEFSKGLTEKLMTYALGRGLERFDRPAVQSVNRRLAAEGYRFSALVMGIVESLPFQMRRGEGPRS
jgi:mono/diheme cytochrome c family protein